LSYKHLVRFLILAVLFIIKSAEMLKPDTNLPLLINTSEYSEEVFTLTITSNL
jgi:hypothetical protein